MTVGPGAGTDAWVHCVSSVTSPFSVSPANSSATNQLPVLLQAYIFLPFSSYSPVHSHLQGRRRGRSSGDSRDRGRWRVPQKATPPLPQGDLRQCKKEIFPSGTSSLSVFGVKGISVNFGKINRKSTHSDKTEAPRRHLLSAQRYATPCRRQRFRPQAEASVT